MKYQQYLKTPYWKRTRKAVMKRDGCCVKCRSKRRLQVHHKTYDHVGRELDHLGIWSYYAGVVIGGCMGDSVVSFHVALYINSTVRQPQHPWCI